eukprot:scaffold10761_cov146-Isochrysis_galbana.AAC.1
MPRRHAKLSGSASRRGEAPSHVATEQTRSAFSVRCSAYAGCEPYATLSPDSCIPTYIKRSGGRV